MSEPRTAMRSRLLFMVLSVACLAPFATGALTDSDDQAEDSLFKQLSVLSEVLTLVQRSYVDETSIQSLLDGALEGATDALDPLATFVPAEHAATYAETRRVGTGRSGLMIAKDRGIAYAVAVIEGSPGAEADIERGDVIAAIDGVSTRNIALWRIEGIFAGAVGTELTVDLLRDGRSVSTTLQLATFERPEVTLARRDELAVLRIPGFEQGSVARVRDLLAPLAGVDDRLVLDLRGAASGSAEMAYEIAALFATGRLGNLSAREEELRSFDSDFPPLWQGELAVVVDAGTHGPGEVLAAVLRQAAAATLIGEPTFGLAGKRRLIDLPSGGQVVMLEGFFAGPDGEPIDHRLRPDEIVHRAPRTPAGEEEPVEDRALERAIEVLERPAEEAAA